MIKMKEISLKNITLKKGFWKSRTDMASETMIPYQWETINNRTPGATLSHAVENFRIAAGESEGSPQGTIFQDSDIAKWIEAASYNLISYPDKKLEESIDELVRLIKKSQKPDGYVNTFFIAAGDEKRWTDLIQGHELYCAGHMMEAAVAYFKATGKRELLDVMCRYADYIDTIFGPEDGKMHTFDGHPEIELALFRLWEVTDNEKYRKLSEHFINIRGSVKNYHEGIAAKEGMILKSKWYYSDYYLAHMPVREMTEATGHAVRAVYLYSAMADMYRENPDPEMLRALQKLWDSTVSKQMYITAALGSQSHGERFTVDYDLPNDTAYGETCASVGLVFWAWRMLRIDSHRKYADIIEKAIFNSALSGISLDGMRYFYVNPLEVKPDIAANRFDHDHVLIHREKWMECACCPTNIGRLITSIGAYISTCSDKEIWIHQYSSSTIQYSMGEKRIEISQTTDYPWDGAVNLVVNPESPSVFSINLRIPAWCGSYTVKINNEPGQTELNENGYLTLDRSWKGGDRISLHLDMPVRIIAANLNVREDSGKAAIMRGPLVYCIEEIDNGPGLHELVIDRDTAFRTTQTNDTMEKTVVLQFEGYREVADDNALYAPIENRRMQKCGIRAIPYFQWGNRKQDQEMLVWLRVK